MSLLARLLARPRAQTEGPLSDFWYRPTGGAYTAAGVRVDQALALKLSAVWRCASLIAGAVASLPLTTYARLPAGGKRPAPEHPLYDLLHDQPSAAQSSYQWREFGQLCLLFRGNFYSRIVAGPRGPVDQLIPIHPDLVTPELMPDGSGQLRYRVRDERTGRDEILFDDEVFHIVGLSLDGRVGLDVITFMAEAVGLGLAEERFAGNFFRQAPQPGVVLEVPGNLREEQEARLRRNWTKDTSGENSHSVKIITQGMKFNQMSVGLTAQQAQIIEAREFSIVDIARWFGVPPHMIGETTKETSWGSGIEQMSLGFVTYTMLSWFRRWEQAISSDLIIANRTYFAEFNVDGLLRADAVARAASLQTLRQNGVISANEWRELYNMNPIGPEGDVYLQPANFVPLGTAPTPAPPSSAGPSGFPPAGGPADQPPAAAFAVHLNGNGRH